MAKIEQYSRFRLHRLTGQGAVFTVPTSNDHTDETWSETDLYIGEIGVNVTDDTVFVRTNNGIVQLGTMTASSGSASNIFILNGSNQIEIGPTYSPTAIVRNGSSFVDLGSSSVRFKDLYLGGSSDGTSIINIGDGFTLRNTSGFIITTQNLGTNLASIIFASQSSTANKLRPVHIQSQSCEISEFGVSRTIIGSLNTTMGGGSRLTAISSQEVIFATNSMFNSTYIGNGFSKVWGESESLGVGGKMHLRGVDDDGSGNYNQSDRVHGQTRLTTSNALTTPIFSYSWIDPSCGEVFSGEFNILGVDVANPDRVYSTKVLYTVAFNGIANQIGDPIINEVSSMSDSVEVICSADGTGLDVSVKGEGYTTIKWLCSYQYHRIINLC